MPRIPPWLFRKARQHSAEAALLLPACRDLQSAINEVRWLQQHVNSSVPTGRRQALVRLCRKRGRGYPLQYILGSQPFGSLDIQCRPGVLIPRPETEAYTCHLVNLIKSGGLNLGNQGVHPGRASIIDFCTGTGCIPLLLFSSLQRHVKDLNVVGVDISAQAVALAKFNIGYNTRRGVLSLPSACQSLEILKGDLFHDDSIGKLAGHHWDIIIANPPYISQSVWDYGRGQLGFSVRKHEPSLALVPGNDLPIPLGWKNEDVFYSRLLDVAHQLGARFILLEVGDEQQALRVIQGLSQHKLSGVSITELWRDWPDLTPGEGEETSVRVQFSQDEYLDVPIRGSGHVRSIFITVMQDDEQ